jgi:hypothetical protein
VVSDHVRPAAALTFACSMVLPSMWEAKFDQLEAGYASDHSFSVVRSPMICPSQ